LCPACDAVLRIRLLYHPRARDDPGDPKVRFRQHVEAVLRRRANQRLPLFPPR
jgi:hypothetical protein